MDFDDIWQNQKTLKYSLHVSVFE